MGSSPVAAIDPLLFVALLCFASLVFLAFCVRKYFASRAREAVVDAPMPITRPTDAQDPTEPVENDPAIERSMSRILETWSATLAVAGDPDDSGSREDQHERSPDAATDRTLEGADLREAVRARVAADHASSHGLSELVRALYLDQSNFRFQMIAELQPEDRTLARALIEKWMANPGDIDYWEGIYAELRDTPDVLRVDRA